MPIDPSIPLAAGQQKFGPDWGVIQNALKTQIAMQQQAQVQQAENALKAAYSDPNNFDPNTLALKPNAMVNLAQQSPQAAMEVRNNMLKGQDQEGRVALNKSKIMDLYGQQAADIGDAARRAEDAALADGKLPERAKEIAQELYTQRMNEWTPNLPPELARQLPRDYSRMRAISSVQSWKEHDEAQKQKLAQEKEARQVKRDEATDTRENRRIAVEEGKADVPQFKGDVKNEDGTTTPGVPLRAGGPTGFTDATGKPVQPIPQTIHKLGAESSKEFAQSKPVVVLDRDGNAVGTYAAREGTKGIGFVRGDTGDPITPPEGGKIVLGTDKDAPAEAKEAVAQAVANYDIPPPPIGARGTKNSIEVIARAKELNPDFNAAKYGAAKVLREGYSRTTMKSPGQRIGSINTAVQHFDALQQLSNNLDNSPIPAKNLIVNYVQKNLGRPDVTSFDIAAQIVADEALNAVIGAGAVFDREKLNKQLTNYRSPAQIKEGIGTLTNLMAGQANTLRQQWKSTGLRESEWHEKLVPEAAELLDPYLDPKGKKRAENEAAIPPKQPAGAPQGNIPTVKTKEERDALPPGAKYYKEGDDLSGPPRTRE